MRTFITGMFVLTSVALLLGQGNQAANEALWQASRDGDTAGITAALTTGANINAKSRYDVTALIFAAGSGRLEAVKLLVSRGADVNATDTFYRARAADMAITNGHTDVTLFLLQSGANADNVLWSAVQGNLEALVKAAVAGNVTRQGLNTALKIAGTAKREALIPLLKAALDKLPADTAPTFTVNPAVLPKYAGSYRDAASGMTMTVTVQNDALMGQVQG